MSSVLSSLERPFSELITSIFQTFWRERKSTRLFEPSSHQMKEVSESFNQRDCCRGGLIEDVRGSVLQESAVLRWAPRKIGKGLLPQLELTFNELLVLPFTSLGCVTCFFLLMIK